MHRNRPLPRRRRLQSFRCAETQRQPPCGPCPLAPSPRFRLDGSSLLGGIAASQEAPVAIIEDVSPTLSNTSFNSSFNFASGRMLSFASADDGKLVFAGSLSSGLWVSEDGGANWAQVEWPQPAPGQFGVPGAIGGTCVPSLAVAPDA